MKLILFSNIFYGLCAVAMATESIVLFSHFELKYFFLLLTIFFSTTTFYTQIYLRPTSVINERTLWYDQNHRNLVVYQYFNYIILSLLSIYFLSTYAGSNLNLSFNNIILFAIALLSISYIGFFAHNKYYSIRNLGYLKPLIIAFVWSSVVTLVPFILGKNILPILLKCFYFIFHFIDNIIFVFILAIIFDLKDIEDDRKSKLMTFSVKLGLNSTLKNIMFPLIYISSIATTLFYTIY
ncbi:MAG: hypothetical protein KBA06_02990, partial [Saprospiraceae bacterium]|nr:hypothetical protein [Saprospiraceae bacterium]